LSGLIIGIDPGTHTGYAESENGTITTVETLRIDEAMARVLAHHQAGRLHIVRWEDARLRKWFGSKGKEALQGAGSIKRDCVIWADFLAAHSIPNRPIPPQVGATKWTLAAFRAATGWTSRTSEHGRDAAILVMGRRS
jgi:hypothetical protein